MTRVESRIGLGTACFLGTALFLLGPTRVPAARASEPIALLLVSDSSSPSAGDAALQHRLEALGYAVRVGDGASVGKSDALEARLVVIAPGAEASEGSLGDLGALPIPIVSLKPGALSGLGLSAQQDLAVAARQGEVSVSDSLHPLAAGFYGKLALDDKALDLPAVRSNGRGRKVVSLRGSSDRALVLAYEVGENTARGPAPARRVGLLLPEALLAGGRRAARDLVTAAVCWATGTNAPPWVFAGPAITTAVDEWTLLSGRASDDGLPGDAPVLSKWTAVSGPADVEFQDDTATLTHARFGTPGEYVLRLTSSDGVAAGSDSVRVIVLAQGDAAASRFGVAPSEPEAALSVLGDILLVVGNTTNLTAGDAAARTQSGSAQA